MDGAPPKGEGLIVGALWLLAIAGWAFGNDHLPLIASFLPATYLIVAFVDFATFALLLHAHRGGRLRSQAILAIVFAVSGAFSLASLACLLGRTAAFSLPISVQSSVWIHLFTQCFGAGSLIAYAAFRRRGRDRTPTTRRFVLWVWTIAAALVVTAIRIAFGYAGHLPHLIEASRFTWLRTEMALPVLALGAASIWLTWNIRRPSALDRAVAFTAIAWGLDALVDVFLQGRFSGGWYAGRTIAIGAACLVPYAVVSSLLRSEERLRRTEGVLVRAQTRLRYQLEHDALTGLTNRSEFCKAVHTAALQEEAFEIAFIDLDRFRKINETSGHFIDDDILVEVSSTLAAVDERDLVARLSGDDFAVLMHAVKSEENLAERLRAYAKVFRKPFHSGDRDGARSLAVAASFGTALFPRDARSADELMAQADVALEVAKKRGGNASVMFSPALETIARERHLQREETALAIERGEFALAYQPTFELNTRQIVGAEALIRWNHPSRGLLQPAEFIPFAERNGLMGQLSHWVLGRVVEDLGNADLPPYFRCYLNLPVHLLDDASFMLELEERLDAIPGFASHLGIELTESEAIQNAERTVASLQVIRRLGLRIAIDDFGTGYSSMAYLKRLPIDIVKIDKTFVDGLPGDVKDRALAQMFLRLTQQFGLISLAEGIESEAQASWLRDNGCLLGQGFLVARPMPCRQLLSAIHDPASDAII